MPQIYNYVDADTNNTIWYDLERPSANKQYCYVFDIYSTGGKAFPAGATKKTHLFSVRGDRVAGAVATGDSYDSLIRASGSNYSASATSYHLRAANVSAANRSGGTMGDVVGVLAGAQNKSGGTVTRSLGASITSENYGVGTTIGGVEIVVKNEGTGVTSEYGLLINNQNAGSGTARKCGPAIKLQSGGAQSQGFDYAIDALSATLFPTTTKVCLMAFKDASGATQYLIYNTSGSALSVSTSL